MCAWLLALLVICQRAAFAQNLSSGIIAFASGRTGAGVNIFGMNPDGSDVKQLTTSEGGVDAHPSWSFNGSMFAYSCALKDGYFKV